MTNHLFSIREQLRQMEALFLLRAKIEASRGKPFIINVKAVIQNDTGQGNMAWGRGDSIGNPDIAAGVDKSCVVAGDDKLCGAGGDVKSVSAAADGKSWSAEAGNGVQARGNGRASGAGANEGPGGNRVQEAVIQNDTGQGNAVAGRGDSIVNSDIAAGVDKSCVVAGDVESVSVAGDDESCVAAGRGRIGEALLEGDLLARGLEPAKGAALEKASLARQGGSGTRGRDRLNPARLCSPATLAALIDREEAISRHGERVARLAKTVAALEPGHAVDDGGNIFAQAAAMCGQLLVEMDKAIATADYMVDELSELDDSVVSLTRRNEQLVGDKGSLEARLAQEERVEKLARERNAARRERAFVNTLLDGYKKECESLKAENADLRQECETIPYERGQAEAMAERLRLQEELLDRLRGGDSMEELAARRGEELATASGLLETLWNRCGRILDSYHKEVSQTAGLKWDLRCLERELEQARLERASLHERLMLVRVYARENRLQSLEELVSGEVPYPAGHDPDERAVAKAVNP